MTFAFVPMCASVVYWYACIFICVLQSFYDWTKHSHFLLAVELGSTIWNKCSNVKGNKPLCSFWALSSLLFSLILLPHTFFTKPSILPVTTVANLCSHWYCPLCYSPLNNSFLHGIEGKAFLIWKMEMYWNNICFKNTDINTTFLKKNSYVSENIEVDSPVKKPSCSAWE